MVLEKTLESPLDCKEIQSVHSEGNQPWDFFGRNDTKAETPVLWPPHAKSWLIGKDSDAGRDWGQEEKGTTEDELAGWNHWLDGRESGWTPGVCDGQGGLACCYSGGRKESDMTEWLNWTELNTYICELKKKKKLLYSHSTPYLNKAVCSFLFLGNHVIQLSLYLSLENTNTGKIVHIEVITKLVLFLFFFAWNSVNSYLCIASSSFFWYTHFWLKSMCFQKSNERRLYTYFMVIFTTKLKIKSIYFSFINILK